MRAMFDARLGTIRERLQVDIGFGDALWPHAECGARRHSANESGECARTSLNANPTDYSDSRPLAFHLEYEGILTGPVLQAMSIGVTGSR